MLVKNTYYKCFGSKQRVNGREQFLGCFTQSGHEYIGPDCEERESGKPISVKSCGIPKVS